MTDIKKLYVIAGCNGAGKTTASFTILPDILNCKEFVNADEIARGLSPFQPEKVAFESGRIMLLRINELVNQGADFAFETTLSTKTYQQKITDARQKGYFVTLVFFWLHNTALAKERVRIRVSEGGHNIPTEIIERRYHRGLKNFFDTYINLCDNVMLFDNSGNTPNFVMQKEKDTEAVIFDNMVYQEIKSSYNG